MKLRIMLQRIRIDSIDRFAQSRSSTTLASTSLYPGFSSFPSPQVMRVSLPAASPRTPETANRSFDLFLPAFLGSAWLSPVSRVSHKWSDTLYGVRRSGVEHLVLLGTYILVCNDGIFKGFLDAAKAW
jgi:hypothetical protein